IHNNVEIKLANEWKYRVLWHFFRGKFPFYDGFVPCSPALWEPFARLSGRGGAEHRVIANYIDVSEIRRKQAETAELPPDLEETVNFAALGKLCHQKGYDLMIPLFAACCREREDLRLFIIGDGPDRAALEQLAGQEAPGRIVFLGARPNPYAVLDRMDAFLSTSRYEGQPLNIEEARVVGLPIYCSKNLEKYSEGLHGLEEEDLKAAILTARKGQKHPDDLTEYNRRILESIYGLA
ncbi:MAG: glycosyltransferase, partial [Oscillospiraceae bacterium]|nr:glycosyltransferase [Oscillospiraceae bacterium]